MAWIKVEEHVPPAGKLVVAYSRVHGSYYIAKWHGARGWLNLDGMPLQIVTEWDDSDLCLPYPILDEIDQEAAKEYGMDSHRSNFYA